MKFPSLPRCFALLASSILALIPAGAAENPAKDSTAPIISEGLSPSFKAVTSRLELGAGFFEFSENKNAPLMITMLDAVMKALPESERSGMPADFTLSKLLSILGFDSIAATGSSSRERADGSFHSRTFAYTPDGRKGLLTLTGGPSEKLLMLEIAPKDTDLAIEFPIQLKGYITDGLPRALSLLSPLERTRFAQQTAEPVPGLNMTMKEFAEKLDLRVGIFARLDPSKTVTLEPNMPPVPIGDVLIAIDRAGWLFKKLLPDLLTKIDESGAPIVKSEDGEVLTLRFDKPMGKEPMDYQPALRFDAKQDRILIASRVSLLESVVAGKERIEQGKAFAQDWRNLPTEGNVVMYASSRFLQTAGDLMGAAMKSAGAPSAADAAIMEQMAAVLKPLLNHGQAMVLSNEVDGVLLRSNSSISPGSSSLPMISGVAMAAGFALPVFSAAQEKGRQATDLNTLRQLSVALRIYATDNNGKYPATLKVLVNSKILENEELLEFKDRKSGQRIPWVYNSKLTDSSPAGSLLLASPVAGKNGSRAAAFNDGSARIITAEEFEKLSGKK